MVMKERVLKAFVLLWLAVAMFSTGYSLAYQPPTHCPTAEDLAGLDWTGVK